MDNYEPGVWLAIAHLAELHRQADQRRPASRLPGRTGGRRRGRAPKSPRRPGRDGQADQTTIARRSPTRRPLHGLLAKVHDPGLPLLEVRRVDPD